MLPSTKKGETNYISLEFYYKPMKNSEFFYEVGQKICITPPIISQLCWKTINDEEVNVWNQ